MNKRRIIAILIAFVLTVAVTATWSAATIQREGDPDAIVLEDSAAGIASGRAAGFEVVQVRHPKDVAALLREKLPATGSRALRQSLPT